MVLLTACASAPTGPASATAPLVVTSVAPLTDLVRRVAEPDATVVGIIPEGADAHTYEPRPSDAELLARADLLIVNGLCLEEPLLDLARANLQPGTPVVRLGDTVLDPADYAFDRSFPREGGCPNPHLWLDPVLARAYVEVTAEALTELDPPHAAGYRERAAALAAELDRLDAAIRAAWQTVPPAHRKLVTYHDSWPYFARRYGLEVIAAIQPADFSEPSLAEVRAIIDQIRTAGVPAVFGSEVFPSDVLEAIAAETGARYVADLRDDVLPGEPGSPEHSYLGMMVVNVRTMVGALGGDPSALDPVDPSRPGGEG